jgi:hypothetical protein
MGPATHVLMVMRALIAPCLAVLIAACSGQASAPPAVGIPLGTAAVGTPSRTDEPPAAVAPAPPAEDAQQDDPGTADAGAEAASVSDAHGSAPASPGGEGARNVGQTMFVALDAPVSVYFNEAAYVAPALQNPVWDRERYTLNGEALALAELACVSEVPIANSAGHLCFELMLVPVDPVLREGRLYEIAVADRVLGSFVARDVVDAESPRVVDLSLTQHELRVTFSERMAAGMCSGSTEGGINVPTYYTTDDPVLSRALVGETRFGGMGAIADVSEDCTTVTFTMRVGIAAGRYDLHVAGVRDAAGGNEVVPEDFTLDVADEGAPQAFPAWEDWASDWGFGTIGRVIRLTFDEPIDPRSVGDLAGYRLNGRPLPAGSLARCRDELCWTILILVTDGFAIRPFEDNTISAPAVRDRSGVAAGASGTATFRGY